MSKQSQNNKIHPGSILSGHLEDQGVADIVQFIEIAKHTGHLLIDFNGEIGEIDFKQGNILAASFGSLTGKEAFFSLVALETGTFNFITKSDISVQDSMGIKNYALILEALKQVDEKGRESLISDALNKSSLSENPEKKTGLNEYLKSNKLGTAPKPDTQSKWLDKMADFLKDSD